MRTIMPSESLSAESTALLDKFDRYTISLKTLGSYEKKEPNTLILASCENLCDHTSELIRQIETYEKRQKICVKEIECRERLFDSQQDGELSSRSEASFNELQELRNRAMTFIDNVRSPKN